MNFIDQTSRYLAQAIRRNNPNAGSEKALFYSLSLMINGLLAIITVLIISVYTNHIYQALLTIFCYTILRYISGGTHLSSSLSCCIFTIVIFLIAAHADFPYYPYGLTLDILSIFIFFKTAPNNIENISKIDKKYYPLLKGLSILIVASNFFIQTPVLSAAFITQAWLTTKVGHLVLHYMERRLGT